MQPLNLVHVSYTISILPSGTWITPSGAPNPSNPADLTFTLQGINGPGLQPNNPAQNITGGIALTWLPATAPTQATITIAQALLFNADRTQLQQAWEAFLAALDAQEGSNQYMPPGGARTTAALLAQNMPMLLAEVAYYRLRFSPAATATYIDLQPGMRLQVAYGNFYNEAHAGAGQQAKNFSAMSASYADIQSTAGSNGLLFNPYMALQQVAVLPPANTVISAANVASTVLDLASQPVKPYHRVFYPQAGFKPSDTATISPANSVSIVSAYCYASLGTKPSPGPVQEACNPLYPKINPTVFFGRCLLTVQLLVKINGQSAYVSAGTTIKNILETAQAGNSQPRMFRVFRYLNGAKTPVLFPNGNTTLGLTIQALPGDEIAWLPSGNFQLGTRLQAIYRITQPAPDATTLASLGIQSFGNVELYDLPVADDMAQALLASHDTPAPYTAAQIGPALFITYNKTPFTDPYTGPMLAYSLYFAGFGAVDVATGVVAGYTPQITLPTGGTLVYYLLGAGIGYTVNDVADGMYQSLCGSLPTNGNYLVKALIEGSTRYGQPYSPNWVAQGTYHAIGFSVANAFQLAATLMEGSAMAGPKYPATVTGPALQYAFQSAGTTLTLNDLAMALAKAWINQPMAYPVDQVALGIFQVYPLSTATSIATALLNSGGNYSMNDVAKGTYAIQNYGPAPGAVLSTEELAAALYTAYGSAAVNTPQNSAIALVYAIPNETPNPVAAAVAKVFGYLTPTPYLQANVNTISLSVIGAFNYAGTPPLQPNVNAVAASLVFAFASIPAGQTATALVAGFQFAVSGTNLAGMSATSQGITSAFAFDKTNQAQVNTTGAALQTAFQVNMQDAASVNTLAQALVAGFSGLQANIAAIAVVTTGAYPGAGDRTYLKSDAQLLTGGLQAAFNGITIQQMLPALQAGFPAFLPVDTGTILTAAYQLNTNNATDIALLGGLAGTTYQLTVAPYGVATVSLVLFAPGYAYLACSNWIGSWYSGWTGADFTIFNAVFTTPIWAAALVQINSRQTPTAMATALQQTYDAAHTMANTMVQILAACYNYLDAAVSVQPVGVAMKAAGYTLVQTSGAMGSGQYQSQWNITYYNMLVTIFSGN